jgi:hypothetical protein
MDAVVTGLIGGSVTSILVIVGGLISVYSGMWERYTHPNIVMTWLTVLTGLTLGQLYLSYSIASAVAAAPVQTEKGVAE